MDKLGNQTRQFFKQHPQYLEVLPLLFKDHPQDFAVIRARLQGVTFREIGENLRKTTQWAALIERRALKAIRIFISSL